MMKTFDNTVIKERIKVAKKTDITKVFNTNRDVIKNVPMFAQASQDVPRLSEIEYWRHWKRTVQRLRSQLKDGKEKQKMSLVDI